MIRRVVTKIISYNETSLVSHGADPFAQKVDEDGNIVNPVHANNNYSSFSEVNPNRGSYVFLDFKEPTSILHNTIHSFNENTHKQNPIIPEDSQKNNQMNELQQFIESLFGTGMLSLAEGKEQTAQEVLALIKQNTSELVSLRASLSTKDTEISSLKETIEANKPMVTVGTQHLTSVRENTLASYNKVAGENPDATIVSLIGDAGLEVLTSLGKTYTAQLEEKHPLHCSECGSHKVSRASSTEEGIDSNSECNGKPLSTRDSLNQLSRAKLAGSK